MHKAINKTIQYSSVSIRYSVILFILLFLSQFSIGIAQTASSSPYSRYGIGDLTGKGFAQNFAMGGTTIAMQSDSLPMFFINNGNPASYSNIRLTTADLGVNYSRVQLQNADVKKSINSASVSNIALAFPFKKWWGASIGLMPYSSVGYKVTDHQEISNIGGVDFLYDGSGGINQLYFGNGIKPFYGLPRRYQNSKKYARLNSAKRPDNVFKTCTEAFDDYMKAKKSLNRKKLLQSISMGANSSYLFGGFDNSRRSIFSSSSYSYSTRSMTKTRVSDIYFDYGMQMSYTVDSVRYKDSKDSCKPVKYRDLKENVKILLGATFSAQTDVKAKIDSISYTYYQDAQGYERSLDTIENTENSKGTIRFPLSFGFGVGFQKGDKWIVAADFAVQNWSTFQSFNQAANLKNSMRVSLGAQYVPNSKASGEGNYPKRMHYRMGVRYAQTALELKNTRLTEYGVSAGIGFPVGRNYLLQSFSMVNIGVEIGQRGTTTNGLIKEQFFKATIGFTINDRWFVKPKFD